VSSRDSRRLMPFYGAKPTPSPEATELTAENRTAPRTLSDWCASKGYATGKMAEPENRLSRVEKHLDLTDPSLPERVLDPRLAGC
jgi:hypothetical protein